MRGDLDATTDGDPIEELRKAKEDDEEEEEEEEDTDEDEDRDAHIPVTLGFVEKPKNGWSLLRQVFPSKAGGVPAWLDPVNLPSGNSSVCGFCGEPLQFLLQIYAPVYEKEPTFHRTLFVFMCPSMACLLQDQHEQWKRQKGQSLRSVKVFRSQLPCDNSFYSCKAPSYNGSDKPSGDGAALCTWCGTWKGNKLCSSCKSARYCSEKHQVLHWRSGHKIECKQMIISLELDSSPNHNGSTTITARKAASKNLWPEFEIICEDECESDAEMAQDCTYSSSLISVSKDRMDESTKSVLKSFGDDGDKESWASFEEQIAKAPEQVLRYCRNKKATPLWPMSSGKPSKADIPECSYCGGPQNYEFQVLPQLLYYFGVKNDADSLDWATVVVYTCEDSCEANMGYKEEFAWVQISSPSATVR